MIATTQWSAYVPMGLVGAALWGLWVYRIITSHRTRPVDNDFRTTTSVVVPSYREDPEILMMCLATWLAAEPTEILVVVDIDDLECQEALASVNDPRLRPIIFRHQGKRSAMGVGIREATSEIIVLSDSDTMWDDGLLAAIQMPFADPKVGAVGTQQHVYQRTSSVWRRLADWMMDLRYYDYVPTMSRHGGVICISGRTAAYRRSAVLPVVDELENETFLGKKCVAGDDGRLTWLILAQGLSTVHQSSAHAHSMFPATFRGFVRQRVRWGRNSARTYLTAMWHRWLWRTTFISQITAIQILLTPVTMSLSFLYLVSRVNLVHPLTIILAVTWVLMGRAIRSWSHLKRHPRDILWLPLYALVVIFLAIPLKAYAIVTMNRQGWLTRSSSHMGGEGQLATSLLPDLE